MVDDLAHPLAVGMEPFMELSRTPVELFPQACAITYDLSQRLVPE